MLAKQLHMYQVHQENCFVFAYLVELLAIILSPTLNTVRHKAQRETQGFKFICGVLFLSPTQAEKHELLFTTLLWLK